jgi:two-component system response regulator DevR
MNPPISLRLLLVDDHPMVRAGLRSLLAQLDPGMSISEAGNVDEAIMEAERSRPDVVVMDVRLGEGSGIEATREIRNRRPKTRVLMFTSYADDEALMASVMAGASGFVLKEVRTDKLLRAIREVAGGKNLLDEDTIRRTFDQLRSASRHSGDDRLARLSEREDGVLSLVADGKTNREIGSELGLSAKTVKNHLSNIMGKLEVERRSAAAAYAARHHTIPQRGW